MDGPGTGQMGGEALDDGLDATEVDVATLDNGLDARDLDGAAMDTTAWMLAM